MIFNIYHILTTLLLTGLVIYIHFNFKYKKIKEKLLLKNKAIERLRGKYKFLLIKNNTLERNHYDISQTLNYTEKDNKDLTKQLNESSKKNKVLQAKVDILENHKTKAISDALLHKETSKKLKDLQFSYMQLEQAYLSLKNKDDQENKP